MKAASPVLCDDGRTGMAEGHIAACRTCHQPCRMIAKFCPHCGAKQSSVFLAARRKLPSLARFTKRPPVPAPQSLLHEKTPPRKPTVRALKEVGVPKDAQSHRSNQQVSTKEPSPDKVGALQSAPPSSNLEHEPAAPSTSPPRSHQAPPPVVPSTLPHDVETRLQGWIARLQKLHAVVITWKPLAPYPSQRALTTSSKAKLERQFTALRHDWDAIGLDKSSTVAARSLALWSRSKGILQAIPAHTPVTDAQVSIKVEGSIMHFKSRWQVDAVDSSSSFPTSDESLPPASANDVPPRAPTTACTQFMPPPSPRKRSRLFILARPTHLFTRVYVVLGSRSPTVVSVDEDGTNEDASLVFRAYCPSTSLVGRVAVSIMTLRQMIPLLHASPLYFRHQLPSTFRHAVFHWVSWCSPVLHGLRWTDHQLTLRFPSVLRRSHVLQYKGLCFYRCLVQVHVLADFSVDVAAVAASTDKVFSVHVTVPLLQVHCPAYLDHVLERFRWPTLFDALVSQLWLEYTTKGFELLVAGQTPLGRALVHPLMRMTDAEWQDFLQLERDRIALVRDDCARLAASVALRKQICRQEQDQKRRHDLRLDHAATSIQRVFRGHMGRIVFHRALRQDAMNHHRLGAMPGTRLHRAISRLQLDAARPSCRDGWFQDPHTLLAYGFSQEHPVACTRVAHWVVTRHDMYRQVLNDRHRLIREAIAAQCIQAHVRRWLCQRRYRSVCRGVVSFQYQVRGALRRRYQRLHRAQHGLSFGFARRVRNTWLLLRIRLRPPGQLPDDGWHVDLAGTHPHAGVSATQRIPMARLAANGTFDGDEWRDMANVDVATRIADATDLFYSAQSSLMTFGVGPTKRSSWGGI